MTTVLATTNGREIDDRALLTLVSDGDCSKLNEAQRLAYYRARCDAAGLDPRAQPFQFVKLNGKVVLYALKTCSEQLAAKHGLSVRLVDTPADVQELAASGGCRAFTARVSGKDGRETDDVGVVTVKGASNDALANAIMKGATKAKRRAVLAHCGLGMLDETEIETIPKAQPIRVTVHDNDGEPTTDDTLAENLRKTVGNGAAAPVAQETRDPANGGGTSLPAPGGRAAGGIHTAGREVGADYSAKDPEPGPPHAGEGPTDIKDRLCAALDEGFNAPEHFRNWEDKHRAEIQALPWKLRKEVLQKMAQASAKGL